MKKLFLISAGLLLTTAVWSQNCYTIKSSVKMEGLPEEYAGFAESEKTVFIKDSKTKTETTSMMMSSVEVFDGNVMTVITEAMGNKSGWSATKEEMENTKDDAPKKEEPKTKFENTSEKKMVAGYECVKTIVTISGIGKDKTEMKISVWHTDKIKKPEGATGGGKSKKRSMSGNNFDFKEISGYPMQIEFQTSQQGMDLKYIETVSEVTTDKLEDSAFTVSTEGYKMMTYKEMKEMNKKQMEGE